jgi:hypothetical protein
MPSKVEAAEVVGSEAIEAASDMVDIWKNKNKLVFQEKSDVSGINSRLIYNISCYATFMLPGVPYLVTFKEGEEM